MSLNAAEDGAWVLGALVSAALFKYAALTSLSRAHLQRAPSASGRKVRVGTLARITIYPVKSMRGTDVKEARCTAVGLWTVDCRLADRSVMVCTSEYNFVTARQKPKLVLVVPSIHGTTLRLDVEGKDTLTLDLDQLSASGERKVNARVWKDTIDAVDCGDAAAEWISFYLDTPGLRVLFHAHDVARRRCDAGKSRWHKQAKESDQVTFQDGFPFMLMSESSVADLNSRMEDKSGSHAAAMAQFRPNFVVSASPPFAEDDWHEISIGPVDFTNIKPCERCILTTVNTKNGTKDPDMEPLRTLRKYRLLEPEFGLAPCFGINLVNTREGVVRVGDEIWATIKPNASRHNPDYEKREHFSLL